MQPFQCFTMHAFSLFFSYLQSFGIRDSDFTIRHSDLPSTLTAPTGLIKLYDFVIFFPSFFDFTNAASNVTLLAKYF